MKFAFVADIHLSKYGADKIDSTSNLPERLHSIMSCLESVADYCLEKEINNVVIGGDVFHGKSVIYSLAQNLFLKYIKKYTDKSLNFWIVDGNHDLSGKGADVVSALYTLKEFPYVKWIESGNPVSFGHILFVPYSHDVADIVKRNKSKILVSHFGLNEAELSSGLSIISDLSVKDLKERYDLVLLGHYHKPQEIISKNFKLYYVGSLIQLDWGEKGEDKRFLVVDTETLDVESVPITNYTKHIEVILEAGNKDEAIKIAKEAKESGNHVKIVMKDRVDIDDIDEEFIVIDKTEVDITDRGITTSMSEEEKFEKYLNIKKIDKGLHKEYLDRAKLIIEEQEEE